MHRMSVPPMLLCWIVALVAGAPVTVAAAGVHALENAPNAGSAEPASVAAACNLTTGFMRTLSYIWTPPEELTEVAWKIPASSCVACGATGGLSLTNVSFGVRWVGVCSAQAQILIVGTSSVDGCLVPDTTQILCGPKTYTISGASSSLQVHSLPLTDGCCLSGDAFLLVRFSGFGECADGSVSPGLAASTGSCVNCDQFVTAANIFPTMTEWCSIGAATPMWFSIAADCCLPTPTRSDSWGSLKIRYR